jgi:hypothetical protein
MFITLLDALLLFNTLLGWFVFAIVGCIDFCLALCSMCYCNLSSGIVISLGRWSNEVFAGLHPRLLDTSF